MLHEALSAAEQLAARGTLVQVVDQPWLNRVDTSWLTELTSGFDTVFVVEDHAPVGGLGDTLRRELCTSRFGFRRRRLAGVWHTAARGLRHHRLDGASLAERIEAAVGARAVS